MTPSKRIGSVIWATLIGTAFAIEITSIKHHDIRRRGIVPLSYVFARMFKVDTTPGKISFTCAWALLSWWFIPHVNRYDCFKGDHGARTTGDFSSDSNT